VTIVLRLREVVNKTLPDSRIMTKPNRHHQSDTATLKKVRVKPPKMYRVLLLNDDFTTMEFVVYILETIFQKSPLEATQIMLQVHKSGRGVAGIFSKQIAEAKIENVHAQAKREGFPLKCVMEEE
jgi:ATP-dependent Clp protease adaptor protein ClpS